MTGPSSATGERRRDPLFPNTRIIARREFFERVRGRPFYASTLLLAALAVIVAFMPVIIRVVDRGTTTTIAVSAEDPQLAKRSADIMGGVLRATSGGATDPYTFITVDPGVDMAAAVSEGQYDGAIVASRDAAGQLHFQFLTGRGIGSDRTQFVVVGSFAVAILEWTERNQAAGAQPFQIPTVDVLAGAGPNAGGAPLGAAQIAARQLLGTVLVVVLFLTIVIYGMWVAAGVAAEKETRVMELLISAASPSQLVLGKVVGIGFAGLTQYIAILVPALLALAVQAPVATLLGVQGVSTPLAGFEPWLFVAYGAFFVLGFTLYALIYAAAGSLVSRVEDLQVIALPMSLIGIAGYLQAVLALTGGLTWWIRLSSYVPFWSPFVMFTRLAVGRVEPAELALSYALLVGGIVLVAGLAIRIYGAGVILYGQRPTPARLLRAVLAPGD